VQDEQLLRAAAALSDRDDSYAAPPESALALSLCSHAALSQKRRRTGRLEKDIAGKLGWGPAKNLPRSAAVDIGTIAGQKRPPREASDSQFKSSSRQSSPN
jgi:hypothetical protein